MCNHDWSFDEFPDGWLATCRRCRLVVSAAWDARSGRLEREFWYGDGRCEPSVPVALGAWGAALEARERRALG